MTLRETWQRADAKSTLPSTDFSGSPPCPIHPCIPASLPHAATWKVVAKNRGTPCWDVIPQMMPEEPCSQEHMQPRLPCGSGMWAQLWLVLRLQSKRFCGEKSKLKLLPTE